MDSTQNFSHSQYIEPIGDCIFPSNNNLEVPTLDINMKAEVCREYNEKENERMLALLKK